MRNDSYLHKAGEGKKIEYEKTWKVAFESTYKRSGSKMAQKPLILSVMSALFSAILLSFV